MPITGIDCTPATLLIDTEAPLDVLFETADYRIRTVTQLLENIAFKEKRGQIYLTLKHGYRSPRLK
ncbi:hypothetical protein [Pseudomonas brassicacearum]|uniref:hypothetical protein n=1 Tax=Pseudomonas brassicacearum TaxID=930166 RepID=UPI001E2E69BC|nr:hypothetical protein [Pseudomonas brassicacearum]